MKKIITCFFVLMVSSVGIAQKPISKVAAIYYENQLLINKFPKKINSQQDFEIACGYIKGINNFLDSRIITDKKMPLLALPAENLMLWANKNADLKNKLLCKLFYLRVISELQYTQKAIEISSELLNYQESFTVTQCQQVLLCLVKGYRQIEAYNEIIKMTPLRKKYATKNDDEIREIENELAKAFFKIKNYNSAIGSFLKVKELYKKDNSLLFVSSMSNNLALCYMNLYDFKLAKVYFDLALQEISQAIALKKESENMPIGYNLFFRSVIKSNIAKIDIQNKNFDKAIASYVDLKNNAKKIGGFESYNISDSYLNISEIYLIKNNVGLATKYLDSCKSSLNKIVPTDKRIDIIEQDAKISLLQGQTQKASMLFNNSKKLSDSIAQVQNGRENILAQAKFNSQEIEAELVSIKLLNKLTQSTSFRQKVALFLAFCLISIIGFLYYKSRTAGKMIQKQKDIMSKSLIEKEILLKELHHRVKNNLQVITGLLQLKSKKVKNPLITNILKDAQLQINSMALVHEMLYRQDEFYAVCINDYMQNLSKQILGSFQENSINVTIASENVNLSINKAIPIGLIISELMTNSYKYAFENTTGEIFIEIASLNNSEYRFLYSDNGKGLPLDFNENMSKTMGLKLIKMLAEEMNGTVEMTNNNGMTATIKFTDNEKM